MDRANKLWLLCALALTGLMDGHASAQTRCFQNVGGVPGAYGEPPTWWLGGAPLGSMTGRWVDDPRWQGASSFSHVSDQARFRVVVETVGTDKFLVMSFHARVDPGGPGDRLYVGFWDETANRGNVLRLQRSQATATPVAGTTYADGAFAGRLFSKVGGSPWVLNNSGGLPVPPIPAWLSNTGNTKIDVFDLAQDEWAVRLRIPIVPGADVTSDNPTGINLTLGGNYRFWYEFQVTDAQDDYAMLHAFPEGLSNAWTVDSAAPGTDAGPPPCGAITNICFPNPSTEWARIQEGGTCVGDISLSASRIYVNTAGNNTISLTGVNALHARPVNNTTSNQSGDAIKGTIRLANWGSTIFDSPAWQPICTDVLGTAGTIAPGAEFDIHCDWTVPDSCPYKPAGDPCGGTSGTRHVDQCMLVDLSSGPGGGGPFFFSPQSAWQNMMFNGASKMEHRARIDLAGLAAIAPDRPKRDVFVYVKTRNMPSKVTEESFFDPERLDPKLRRRLADIKFPKGAIGRETAQQLQAALTRGQLTHDDLEAIMPTYIAYVWHDSGKTVDIGTGHELRLLSPQTSFGYFVWHDGDLTGWRHGFEGMDITELAPNFYKLSVPEGGHLDVTATVETLGDVCEDNPAAPECKPCEKDRAGAACKQFCASNADADLCNPCLSAPNGAECQALCAKEPKPRGCPACEYPLCLELWQWLVIVLLFVILLVWLLRKRS